MRLKHLFAGLLAAGILSNVANAQAPGSAGTPNPIGVRTPQTVPMAAITLTANTSTLLSLLNPTRKSIQILNIGTTFCTVRTFQAAGTGGAVPTAPGQASATSNAVTVGVGYPLEASPGGQGHQGGSTPIYDGASTSTDEWDGICPTGGTLLVIEGN